MYKIHFGPLQGFTNHTYRRLHKKYFGGVDKYYSPYLRFEKNKDFKKSSFRDLLPENNIDIPFVPQVLGSNADIFIDVAKQIEEWGYKELNWNLGCPYPMVTKRGFGSALVAKPDEVRDILEKVFPKLTVGLSVKCRLGLSDENEIYKLIEVLNDFEIKELTVHTRIAKQLYKGKADPLKFVPLIEKSRHKLIYNGDITSVEEIDKLNKVFGGKQDDFMIGRGLLMNPFLAAEIKGRNFNDVEKKKIITNFHSELFQSYRDSLQASHLLVTMKSQWEYLSFLFEDQRKSYKRIKKAQTIEHYNDSVEEVLNSKLRG
ncbi:MAG: tRNA-dihydrouridine synthase family protein [Bacteroidota bacterium]